MTDWTSPSFDIGDTHFEVRRLLPEEQFALFEKIRPGLETIPAILGEIDANAAADFFRSASLQLSPSPEAGKALVTAAFRVLTKIPPETVATLKQTLFPHISYTSPTQAQPMTVQPTGSAAFAGKSMLAIYEVIGRAFTVNFFDCWGDLLSMLGSAPPDSAPSKPQT